MSNMFKMREAYLQHEREWNERVAKEQFAETKDGMRARILDQENKIKELEAELRQVHEELDRWKPRQIGTPY